MDGITNVSKLFESGGILNQTMDHGITTSFLNLLLFCFDLTDASILSTAALISDTTVKSGVGTG